MRGAGMYKVVIIDDEPLIVEGLSRSIPWERWNCKVVGFGYNGIEGMEVIRREKPAIVISDISMPKMDGLTMIAGLKSEFPYMQVSILTGYREFTYAQEAIRLGVSAFLLKPSKMDELYEAIEAMTEKLGQRHDNLEINLECVTAFHVCGFFQFQRQALHVPGQHYDGECQVTGYLRQDHGQHG